MPWTKDENRRREVRELVMTEHVIRVYITSSIYFLGRICYIQKPVLIFISLVHSQHAVMRSWHALTAYDDEETLGFG
jgi:hypothetical protein